MTYFKTTDMNSSAIQCLVIICCIHFVISYHQAKAVILSGEYVSDAGLLSLFGDEMSLFWMIYNLEVFLKVERPQRT